MLLTNEVEVEINKSNYKYYKKKQGYDIPLLDYENGDTHTILMKLEDLSSYDKNVTKITYTCDFCGVLRESTYRAYRLQTNRNNGISRCSVCSSTQGRAKERAERIKNGESFEMACKKYNLLKWVSTWDYNKNIDSPSELFQGEHAHRYFKCDRGLHESFIKPTMGIIRKRQEYLCPYCNSFGQYLLDEFGKDAIKMYWSDKNEISPFEIGKYSSKKVYFKCTETNYHDDYISNVSTFTSGCRCPQCHNIKGNFHPKDSFGEYLKENNLFHLWSDKNEIDPYKIYYRSSQYKILLACDKTDYHGDYVTTAHKFVTGTRCSYCARKLIHPLDSFAQYHIDNTDSNFLENYWSDKNTLNPFEISVGSGHKVLIKCQNGHEDYLVGCDMFSGDNNRCPICKESKGERSVRDFLIKNNMEFEAQKTFDNLTGVGNYPLSYDFYIPQFNLLIEYQGEYHYMPVYYKNKTKEYCDNKFAKQQEHDRRKREYAESHNITSLEIPYWDYDNVESILAEALHIDIDTNSTNSTNNTNNDTTNNIINTYIQSSSDNVYTKVKVNKEEFDFPTVEEIMRM